MAVRSFQPHESIPRKSDEHWKTKYLYENHAIAKEMAQGEAFVDGFCWTLFGLSALYFIMSLLAR